MRCFNITNYLKYIFVPCYKMPNITAYKLSINNNYKLAFIALIFLIYFTWMDIGLFVNLQKWTPNINENTNSNNNQQQQQQNQNHHNNLSFKPTSITSVDHLESSVGDKNLKSNKNEPVLITPDITVYNPLTVKLIMIDHVTHYVHDIVARFIEDTLHFTYYFPWVTANVVSLTGLGLALASGKLILSDRLAYRRLGCVLFELRNFADSLDGVVYRSRAKKYFTYESIHGTLGYNVDIICDGLAGVIIMLAIFIRFLRNPPHRTFSTLSIYSCNPNENRQYYKENTYSYNQNNQIDANSSSLSPLLNDNDSPSMHNCKINNKDTLNPNDTILKMNCSNCTNNTNNQIRKLNDNTIISNGNSGGYFNGHVTLRQVKLIVIPFGIRILFTGLIWDHFVRKYQTLLQVDTDNETYRAMQTKVFKSIGMWLIMWFWRLGNACAILEHIVIAVFIDKIWEYMVITSFIGWLYLIVLTLFTQIHYTEVSETLMRLFSYA